MRQRIEIVEGHPIVIAQNRVHVIRIVEIRPTLGQSIGASTKTAGSLQSIYERKTLSCARSIKLRLGEAARPRQLGHQCNLEGVGIASRLPGRREDEHVGAVSESEVETTDTGRNLL